MMKIIETIKQKLINELSPSLLEIQDDSDEHANHYPVELGNVSHIKITIRSASFKGVSKLKQHQQIYKILAEEIPQIHAVQIDSGV